MGECLRNDVWLNPLEVYMSVSRTESVGTGKLHSVLNNATSYFCAGGLRGT
jgi:hypothetical protein